MANQRHVAMLLRGGVQVWNLWRKKDEQEIEPDFSKADLHGADLRSVDLHNADLRRADLRWTNLTGGFKTPPIGGHRAAV